MSSKVPQFNLWNNCLLCDTNLVAGFHGRLRSFIRDTEGGQEKLRRRIRHAGKLYSLVSSEYNQVFHPGDECGDDGLSG